MTHLFLLPDAVCAGTVVDVVVGATGAVVVLVAC